MLAILFSLTILANPMQSAERLDLICSGGGAANKTDSTTVQGWDNNGNYATGTAQSNSRVGFADQVDLWIEGESGSIRLPRIMLPLFRGGKDGWFTLKNVKVTDTEINASAAVNPLNNPKVRIDRRTGVISISGKAGQYTGECKKVDAATANRF